MPVIHDPISVTKPVFSRDSALDSPVLSVQNLSFSYPDGQTALQNVSLAIEHGEKVALVGPNGAGKSTLMLHLNGILSGEGQVRIAGLEVNQSNLPLIRAKVGLVFQDPDDQLFMPTVYEDVAFGPLHMGLPEQDVHHRVKKALELVGMPEFGDRLSHHLSAGEKKRISIATALSMEPEILVFDEPTAGLDPRARRGLMRLLKRLSLTVLVSTHDMNMVYEIFSRVVILDEGRIVADGPAESVLSDVDLLESHGLESPFEPLS